jgi:hypothetical protein
MDVAKTLALGANAVALGTPVWWALALGGAGVVSGLIDSFHRELVNTPPAGPEASLRASDRRRTLVEAIVVDAGGVFKSSMPATGDRRPRAGRSVYHAKEW